MAAMRQTRIEANTPDPLRAVLRNHRGTLAGVAVFSAIINFMCSPRRCA